MSAAPSPILRPLAGDDADLYLALYTDPVAMRLVGEPLDAAAAQRALATSLRLGALPELRYRLWTIRPDASADAVGLAGLRRGPGFPAAAGEIGVMLLPSWQGQGLGTAALAALALHAFEQLHLERLFGFQAMTDLRVDAMLRRVGFVPITKPPYAGSACACWQLDCHALRVRPDGLS